MHCSSVHIAATSPGHTLVTVSVTGHEEHAWSSATFAAYEPLKVSHPGRPGEPWLLAIYAISLELAGRICDLATHSVLSNLSSHS